MKVTKDYNNLDFSCLTQEEIAWLLEDNKQLVNKIARRYFLVGGTTDDLIQEGMIGLFSAITNFSNKQNCSFKTFASLCIERNIQDAVKSANRQKNIPLNDFFEVSEDGKVHIPQENQTDKIVYLPAIESSPEEQYILKSQNNQLLQEINSKLSTLEKKILAMYVDGLSITNISQALKISHKSVYNALARIKQKLSFLNNKN